MLGLLTACTYDQQDFINRLSELEERVSVLEQAQKDGDVITAVTEIREDGVLVGYRIEFRKASSIDVFFGRDGHDGQNGQDGKDGDSLFKSVTVTDKEVTFVMTSGQTFVIKRAAALTISFDSADLVVMETNATRNIKYTISSEFDDITIEALGSGDIKAKVVKSGSKTGAIQVKTGAVIDEYSKVVVLVTNGSQAIMRTLIFEEQAIYVEENTTKEVGQSGGSVELEFFTNMTCHAEIPEAAADWISVESGTKAVGAKHITLNVKSNSKGARSATVTVKNEEDAIVLMYNIYQSPNKNYQLTLERNALISIYNKTNGDNWHDAYGVGRDVRKNWCSSQPISSWFGVETQKGTGFVTSLNLQAMSLQGAIPEEFGVFSELKYLLLDNNLFAGNIPESFVNLRKLEKLSLMDCHLSGEIPSFLGSLTHLKELWLHNNYFSGSIPVSLTNLKELVDLRLVGNLLSGCIDDAFYSWPIWKSSWGWSIEDNLFSFEDICIPAPNFSIVTVDGKHVDSSELYAGHKYTILLQCEEPSYYTYFPEWLNELRDIQTEFGDEVAILCWIQWNKSLGITSETEAKAFFERNSFPGDCFFWDNHDYSLITGKTDGFYNSFGAVQCYPSYYTPSLTLVDKTGRVVLTDMFDKSMNPASRNERKLTKWLRGESDPLVPERYRSSDYSKDGTVKCLQAGISGGPNLIILGDGFTDRLIEQFENSAMSAVNAFFLEEPFASYKGKYNVYLVDAVSDNEEFEAGCKTAFSCTFGDGTLIQGNNKKCISYALKAVGDNEIDKSVIVVLVNKDKYAGTCYMYGGWYGGQTGEGVSVAYCPVVSDLFVFNGLISHEAGGHGFAKLGDEYAGTLCDAVYDDFEFRSKYGWWKNIDNTGDPAKVKWAQFISDERYAAEKIGCYEGAFTFNTGFWRPTENSIMNTNTDGFNAPSRQAIWYRINKLSNGDNWDGTYEDFVTYDQVNRSQSSIHRRQEQARRRLIEKPLPPLAPPVVLDYSWRDEMNRNQ